MYMYVVQSYSNGHRLLSILSDICNQNYTRVSIIFPAVEKMLAMSGLLRDHYNSRLTGSDNKSNKMNTLHLCHNGRSGVSNHQPRDSLLNRLFRRRSKKISKLRVTGLYEGNSPGTGEFPAQRPSNAENVSIWWRHHESYCSVSPCVSALDR